jgi:hypothetical protein
MPCDDVHTVLGCVKTLVDNIAALLKVGAKGFDNLILVQGQLPY